jgi:general secretion pathway protein G
MEYGVRGRAVGMSRSHPLAEFLVGGLQCSVRTRPISSVFLTRHSAHATRQCARRAGAGFTLIELLVVIAIIAILAGLTLSTLGYVNRKGAESRAKSEVAALSAAIDSYKLDFGSYPTNQANLYRELTGTATGAGAVNTNKVFFEPTPQMLITNSGTVSFVDPWGSAYEYRTGAQATNNVGFFDLWSTAGGTNANNWIRN